LNDFNAPLIKGDFVFWSSRKKLVNKLKASWGKPKDDAFKFELIEHYFRKKDKSSAVQVISDQTMRDLDFYSLFAFADRTNSRIGQQWLFNTLLTLNAAPDFDEQEKIIDHVTKNEFDRLKTQIVLSRLSDAKAFHISWLFLKDFVDPPKYFPLIKYLSAAAFLSVMVSLLIPKALFIAIGIIEIGGAHV
jgi:hypothetical protein